MLPREGTQGGKGGKGGLAVRAGPEGREFLQNVGSGGGGEEDDDLPGHHQGGDCVNSCHRVIRKSLSQTFL